ncbi:transposable element Tcb1 transposase [Trichonephila clavipes]|nr:transposable element Tcb1 transposase [Trichonephila clavipes]
MYMTKERTDCRFDVRQLFIRSFLCDWEVSFREIGQHVGQNKATVMWICHRWMQEETSDRWGRSHPLRFTTAHDDRRIAHLTVMDHAATSRIIAQLIQSVTHHSVSACTIRRRMQQTGMSARHSLLCLLLTGNHRCLRRQ